MNRCGRSVTAPRRRQHRHQFAHPFAYVFLTFDDEAMPSVGNGHQRHSAISRVGEPGHQFPSLEALNQLSHRGLADLGR
jgi:hypothetical protein